MTTRPVILRTDARALPLPSASADLIVTSPPYLGQRDYQDSDGSLTGQLGAEETPKAYIAALLECTAEWMRVLKPAGSMFVVLGDAYSAYNNNRGPSRSLSASADPGRGRVTHPGLLDHVRNKSLYGLPWRYALGCIDELGLILRAEIIWAKPNPMPTPRRVRDRVSRDHEHVLHLVKQPRYFATDEARRYSGVWDIPVQTLKVPPGVGLRRHYAVFPLEMPRRCIEGWAPPGGAVLDPFGGTGTTLVMATAMGRTGITADLSWDYCKVAAWRSEDPREMGKALKKASSGLIA